MLGGIIPVPITVGNNDEHKLKLFRIWKILNDPYLISEQKTIQKIEDFFDKKNVEFNINEIVSKTILFETITPDSGFGTIFNSEPDNIAFIQFSSGSTGDPKGVILTHQNLNINISALTSLWKIEDHDSLLSWVPLTHDMGLILIHLTGLASGINQYMMPTNLFIKQPTLWIKKASEYKITQLYSPNFGYHYFLKFYQPEKERDWDLSNVRFIVNGAEPISAELCYRFLERLGKFGLKRTTMQPVYGLAEATVGVAAQPLGEEIVPLTLDREFLGVGQTVKEARSSERSVTFVEIGPPVKDCELRICDDQNNILNDNVVGYIQVNGKSVTQGYYNNAVATSKAITKDGWLNTGDLGFLRNGRLVVTGRAKDIIFVNGQNYYPHDIERVAESAGGIELGKCVASGVFNPDLQTEEIILFVLFKGKLEDFVPIVDQLTECIGKYMGLEISKVVPVKRILKTTSGKVQRYKLGQVYSNGEFSEVLHELERLMRNKANEEDHHEPFTDVEKKLVNIWKEVFGVPNVGTNDSFFKLGGNSIKAAKLSFRIQEEFEVEIQLNDIFANATITNLAECIKQTKTSLYRPIPAAKEKEFPLVSAAQKRIYMVCQREGVGTSYNLPVVLQITGEPDRKTLEEFLRKLIARHEILRTAFQIIDGRLVQLIHPQVAFELNFMEIEEENVNPVIQSLIRPFDLSKAPLFRIFWLKIHHHKYLLLFDIHHLIADGASIEILTNELKVLYQGGDLPQTQISYQDFSEWHNDFLETEAVIKQKNYWLNRFKNKIPPLNLALDYHRPPLRSFEGDTVITEISPGLVKKLNQLTKGTETTTYMVLLAVYNILLAKYSNQEDISLGSPVSGRNHADLNNLVGMFVNTVVMRNYPVGTKTFRSFLNEVKINTLNAYENQDFQFEDLVEKLNTEGDLSRNPLFDTVFALQNGTFGGFSAGKLDFFFYPVDHPKAQFEMTFKVIEKGAGLEFRLEYCLKLFKRETIERMMIHFLNILEQILDFPDRAIYELNMLSNEEKQWLIYEQNKTGFAYPNAKTILQSFEDTVTETPDRICIIDQVRTITYGELDRRANQVGWALRKRGVGAEVVVGICLTRSIEMIIGMLGVFKAGGAYLPLDPEYPGERLGFMLRDAKVTVLLTQAKAAERFTDLEAEVIYLDQDPPFARAEPDRKPDCQISNDHLAYVIYTSGSTGQPKGVLVPHQGLLNLVWWHIREFQVTPADRATQLAGLGFDASVWEIWPYLISGARLYLVEPRESNSAGRTKRLDGRRGNHDQLCAHSPGGRDATAGVAPKDRA